MITEKLSEQLSAQISEKLDLSRSHDCLELRNIVGPPLIQTAFE